MRYDLPSVRKRWSQADLATRPKDLWRYFEVLPLEDRSEVITLGEGYTPLLPLDRAGEELGIARLYVKEEAANPTASFKARGLAVAVSMAKKLGAKKLAIPSAGNAGAALAAYGARAGLPVLAYVPEDAPASALQEMRITQAHVTIVRGSIADAGQALRADPDWEQCFDVSTLKEPYRLEGKKTMGYEIAEQLNWQLPDVIVYPTGGGTGLIGLWKAFQEMEALGWIDGRRPRLVAVQSEGCAPIVKAFREGRQRAQLWPNPHTFAAGMRVPQAVGDVLMLQALRETQGQAVTTSDATIRRAIGHLAVREGLFVCPEGAACWAALVELKKEGWLRSDETAVFFNTASGLKYLDRLEHP